MKIKKTILYTFLATAITGASLTSCEDMFGGFLDKQPSNELSEDEVFSSWTNTEQFHFDTYNFLRHGACRINSSWMDAATDLAHTSYSYGGTRVSFNIGNYYTSGASNELTDTWETYYRGIRKCNMLLARIDQVPKSSDDTQENYERDLRVYKAEARFFRAYFHWELFLRYGAIPVITEVLDPDGDLITDYKERPTVKEFVQDFILKELIGGVEVTNGTPGGCMPDLLSLDEVRKDLANLGGRITQPAALALASRIELYMASKRFAGQTDVTWQNAADLAKLFIDKFGSDGQKDNKYSLYRGTGDADIPKLNYQNAILTTATDQGKNPEIIFWRNDAVACWAAIANDTPVGEGGNGGLCPSQNLIDMYDMLDGSSPFTEYDETGAPVYDKATLKPSGIVAGSRYNDNNPCSSRDPRLNASILYHGCTWGSGIIDVIKGHRDNPTGNANATPTGYYVRKYMPENILTNNHAGVEYRNWIIFRYAEILLNYAEALCEAGKVPEALQAIQPLRDRVGLSLKLTERADLKEQEAALHFIRKERTVELAFEDHRAWDLRRWNVAEKALARDIYGVEVTQERGQLKYTRKVVGNRVFEEKMYLYPIPEAEVWKTGIENNPGW